MPSRRNKKKGKAPARTKGNSTTTPAVLTLGTGGTSSHSAANPVPPPKPAATALPAVDTTLITNLRHGVRSFLSSLHDDWWWNTHVTIQWKLQRSLEAHLRNHYTSIQSDATWRHILGWPPWHSAASARESLRPGEAGLESPYNLPPAADFEFVQVVGRRPGVFFPDVDAWDQVPYVSSQARPARWQGAPLPDTEAWGQVTSQASPAAGSGSEARRTSYSSAAALELPPAHRHPPDHGTHENLHTGLGSNYPNNHISARTLRTPASPLMPRVQTNSDEFCTGGGWDSVGVGDFQSRFPRYPAVDVDDVYEFPALPTPRQTQQPAWGTHRDPAQLGRNSSLPQRLVAERVPLPVPRSATVPHSQPDPMRARSPTPPPQSNPVDASGDLTRKLAEEASILLELYSRSTCGDLESDLQHRETIKSALDNVTKIWDRFSPADKGKQASVVGNRGAAAKSESDPALSPYSGCIICYSVVADALLMPCRHLVLCLGCCDTMGVQESMVWGAPRVAEGVKCPLCRVEVSHRIKVYRG